VTKVSLGTQRLCVVGLIIFATGCEQIQKLFPGGLTSKTSTPQSETAVQPAAQPPKKSVAPLFGKGEVKNKVIAFIKEHPQASLAQVTEEATKAISTVGYLAEFHGQQVKDTPLIESESASIALYARVDRQLCGTVNFILPTTQMNQTKVSVLTPDGLLSVPFTKEFYPGHAVIKDVKSGKEIASLSVPVQSPIYNVGADGKSLYFMYILGPEVSRWWQGLKVPNGKKLTPFLVLELGTDVMKFSADLNFYVQQPKKFEEVGKDVSKQHFTTDTFDVLVTDICYMDLSKTAKK
jgi:hypothetical protein